MSIGLEQGVQQHGAKTHSLPEQPCLRRRRAPRSRALSGADLHSKTSKQVQVQATSAPCSYCRHRHAALLPPAAALAGLDTSFTWRPVTGSFLQRVLDDLTQALARNERLLVVAASTFIMSTSHTALRPVMPLFVKSFGVGAAAVGATLTVYATARLLMNIPAGLLADRFGRRPLLVWGPAITAAGMLWTGYAGSYGSLLLGRWLTGIGSAVQMLGAQLFLADISKSSNRARHLGINHQAALAGSLLGPALGGWLADSYGLRAPFAFTGAAALLAALYGLARLPETSTWSRSDNSARPAEVSSAEASTSGRADASTSVPEQHAPSSQQPWLEQLTSGQLWHRAVSRMASWRAQPGGAKLLRCQDFRAIAALNAVMYATANGSRSMLMPLLAIHQFGMSTTTLGFIFAAMACTSLVVTQPAAWLADLWGRKAIIMPSCLGVAASVLLMALCGSRAVFLLAAFVFSFAQACIGANPYAYLSDVMPPESSGLGLSMYRSAGDIGLMFGPAMLGIMADVTSVRAAMAANGVALVACALFFHLTARESMPQQDPAR